MPINSTLEAHDFAHMTDITQQIITNAEVLFSRDHDLKVITAQARASLHYAALMASDNKSASINKEYKTLLVSAGEPTRRESVLKLLEETERRIAKQILKR
ncbi:hypothetical protein LTR78_000459 [Recurvomyces mirabilis]|uniref:Uncharacterized protein n=1 Tax=Recurvomyces mirabilis TaxID=574656 RepID=A0AAE0WXA9_9PEZI|nr:hypothetical protein LTR78_000459 [Recurvomyces mirabilis]KAK5162114.1 hypothetical protein LTS14_000460 [Recurvomyces mirabilis]